MGKIGKTLAPVQGRRNRPEGFSGRLDYSVQTFGTLFANLRDRPH
jgi:hypothetical protein